MGIFSRKINFRIATLLVTVIVLTSFLPIFSRTAAAQWVVWDPGNFVPNFATAVNTGISAGTDVSQAAKEFGLDTVAWVIVNLIIERMAASTVNWINNGFQGQPAYVTNPQAYFADIGDKIAGQFIFSNPNLDFLCGPISFKVKLALQTNHIRDNIRWQCTLSQVGANIDDFLGDFAQGGWDGFFELTQKQQNNPIGAYLQAQNELEAQIASRKGIKEKELDWGNGFLSWEECTTTTSTGSSGNTSSSNTVKNCQINTPGSVIENKLNDVLGIGNNKLAAADEINEIVSALLNQLISQVVGGVGRGLRGISGGNGAGGQSLTNQLNNSTQTSIRDYFDNPVNPNILPVPPPVEPIDQNDLTSGIPKKFFGVTPTGQICDPTVDPSCATQTP